MNVDYVPVVAAQVEELLVLMEEYYAYDHLLFDKSVMRIRLNNFLSEERWGEIRFMKMGQETIGYFILLFGFGLEHGKNVLIDEFYIRPSFQGKGIGKKTFAFIEELAKKKGLSSIHADVETSNARAQQFWTGHGLLRHDRSPHIKRL